MADIKIYGTLVNSEAEGKLANAEQIALKESNDYSGTQVQSVIEELARRKQADGKSAFELAKEAGLTDAETLEEWISSLKGEPGEPGEQGPQGPRGPKGEQGNSGIFIQSELGDGQMHVVNNLIDGGCGDNETNEVFVLSAEQGKILGIKTRVVIDEFIDDEEGFNALYEIDWSGTDGYVVFYNGLIHYFFTDIPNADMHDVIERQLTLGGLSTETHINDGEIHPGSTLVNSNVTYDMQSTPDSHLLYLNKPANKVIRWDEDTQDFVDVASGNLGAYFQGNRLVITKIVGDIQVPSIKMTIDRPTLSATLNSTAQATITVTGKNLSSNVTLKVNGNSDMFNISTTSLTPVNGKLNSSVVVTFKPTSGTAGVTTYSTKIIAEYEQQDYASVDIQGDVVAGPGIDTDVNGNTIQMYYGTPQVNWGQSNKDINVRSHNLLSNVIITLGNPLAFTGNQPQYTGFSLAQSTELTFITYGPSELDSGLEIPIYYVNNDEEDNTDHATALTISSETDEFDALHYTVIASRMNPLDVGEEFIKDGITYVVYEQLDSNSNRILFGVAAKEDSSLTGEVTIPDKVEDDRGYEYDVVAIVRWSGVNTAPNGSFKNVTILNIPDSIVRIEVGALAYSSIKAINSYIIGTFYIPESSSLKAIGQNACIHMSNLTSIVIKKTNVAGGLNAFGSCENLEYVEVAETTSAFTSFRNCTSLTIVKYGGETLGSNMFNGCENLNTLYLPYEGVVTRANLNGNPSDGLQLTPQGNTPQADEEMLSKQVDVYVNSNKVNDYTNNTLWGGKFKSIQAIPE